MATVKFELTKEEETEYRNFVRELLKDGFIRDNYKLVLEAIGSACRERIDRIVDKPMVLDRMYRDIKLESASKFNLKDEFEEIARKYLTKYIENLVNDEEKMYKLFERIFQPRFEQFVKLFVGYENRKD